MEISVLRSFRKQLDGDFFFDHTLRSLYATDASAYREMPLAVAIPKTKEDLKKLIAFAREHKTSIIPRTAGTSLAGQVVGNGIIVDVSKHFTRILEVNREESWVRLEPGVVRDELNFYLKDHGLFFGPETSTANRAMIGGMVGNNSCGANSVIFGSTRDHLMEVKMLLADGQEVIFSSLSDNEYHEKVTGKKCTSDVEKRVYATLDSILSDPHNQEEIEREFPKPEIPRRNTGYAIDLMLQSSPYGKSGDPFNMCRLIAGSEGTLGLITEIKLHVDPLPPIHKALVCIHFDSLYDSLEANLIALTYNPHASELIDHFILECTKENLAQQKNRFFIQGDPKAILIVELAADSDEELNITTDQLIQELKNKKFGYHYPVLKGKDMSKIWNLRKAGLGLLSNIPGDAKPVPVIEDTAVDVQDLPAYIKEFNDTLKKYGLYCVHYAHAGSGELHLRPIINLKTSDGQELFRTVLDEVARLVKKYRGSLSGEHGDGRLRGEFISYMIGTKNYALLERVKESWDPEYIFNPGKIVKTPPMNSFLRYEKDQPTPDIATYFDFSKTGGFLRAAELCNGSGDCRKSALSGGTMCPSYMASKDEKDTTRARANILREMITHSQKENRFDHREINDVLDLCLSCKGCKSECPSNVDMARLKAEFLQQYHDANGVPIRSRLIANITRINRLISPIAGAYNALVNNPLTGSFIKSMLGFSTSRTLPKLHRITLKKWYAKHSQHSGQKKNRVYLFNDEFTNFNDVNAGISAIRLLRALGYEVLLIETEESGRTYLSKGLVKEAKILAETNIKLYNGKVSSASPLIGIEPSAILSFRDEYPDLVSAHLREAAREIARNTFTFEEFISHEFKSGRIVRDLFTEQPENILLHGHCHQKSLSAMHYAETSLSIPLNYKVKTIPSGCCGMAGSFGFEKEHYNLSMQIGELILLPEVRRAPDNAIIAASGTSCRHQILDGADRIASHPAEILYEALKVKPVE